MTCDDIDCSCRLVGRHYRDLTDHENDLFQQDDGLDLCTVCGQINTLDNLGTDDFTGEIVGVCDTCFN